MRGGTVWQAHFTDNGPLLLEMQREGGRAEPGAGE